MMEVVGGYSELLAMPLPAYNMLKEHIEWEFEQKSKQTKHRR